MATQSLISYHLDGSEVSTICLRVLKILPLFQASSASLPHANIRGPRHDLSLSLESRDTASMNEITPSRIDPSAFSS